MQYRPITVLTRYSRRAGSSRLRHYLYLDHLREAGHSVEVQAFFKDSHLDSIYGLRSQPAYRQYIAAYVERVRFLAAARRDSIAWVEKEVFARLPARFDCAALGRFKASVIDLDDAWFLRYEQAPSRWLSPLREKMTRLFAASDIVTVPNVFLLEQIKMRGARDARVIGPGIDTNHFSPAVGRSSDGPVTIGWIGTPLNAAEYLPPLVPILNALTRDHSCRVLLVGAGNSVPELKADRREWSEASEVENLHAFDIGIMPLTDTVWNRCKSGFKLLQSMSCGQAAVGSAVGFNSELITHGETGMLVNPIRPKEWHDALEYLVTDAGARETLGRQARDSVVARFSVSRRAEDLCDLFSSIN